MPADERAFAFAAIVEERKSPLRKIQSALAAFVQLITKTELECVSVANSIHFIVFCAAHLPHRRACACLVCFGGAALAEINQRSTGQHSKCGVRSFLSRLCLFDYGDNIDIQSSHSDEHAMVIIALFFGDAG